MAYGEGKFKHLCPSWPFTLCLTDIQKVKWILPSPVFIWYELYLADSCRVCVLVEEPECFWAALMERKVSVCSSQCLFGAVGYCPAAGGLYLGSSEAEMILLGTRVVFCHVNDPCQRGCAGELQGELQLFGSSGFPACAKRGTRMANGSCAEGKALSGASITLLLGFGRGVLGEECSTLTCTGTDAAPCLCLE